MGDPRSTPSAAAAHRADPSGAVGGGPAGGSNPDIEDIDLDQRVDELLAEIDSAISTFEERARSRDSDTPPDLDLDAGVLTDEGVVDPDLAANLIRHDGEGSEAEPEPEMPEDVDPVGEVDIDEADPASDTAHDELLGELDDLLDAEVESIIDEEQTRNEAAGPELGPAPTVEELDDDLSNLGLDDEDLSGGVDDLLDDLDDPYRKEPVEAAPDAEPAPDTERAGEVADAPAEPVGADELDEELSASAADDLSAEDDIAIDELDHELAALIDEDSGPDRFGGDRERVANGEDGGTGAAVATENGGGGAAGEKVPESVPSRLEKKAEAARPKAERPASTRPAVPTDAEWRDWLAYAWQLVKWCVPIVLRFAARNGERALVVASPHVAGALERSSEPIDKKNPMLRSMLGWVALYTAFLAACVWIYVTLVRTPKTPEPDGTPVSIVSTDEP